MHNFEDEAWFASIVLNIATKHGITIDIDFNNQILDFKGNSDKSLNAFIEMKEIFSNIE